MAADVERASCFQRSFQNLVLEYRVWGVDDILEVADLNEKIERLDEA